MNLKQQDDDEDPGNWSLWRQARQGLASWSLLAAQKGIRNLFSASNAAQKPSHKIRPLLLSDSSIGDLTN